MADGAHVLAPPRHRDWTTRELATVREHYPAGGIDAVLAHLPHRTRSAVYNKAAQLGLRCPGQPRVREHWPVDPCMDHAIRTAHQRVMQRGDVQRLAKRLGRPVWWVSRRARDLGLTTPRFREPRWSEAELDILRQTTDYAPPAVQRALKRAGYARTANAIAVQRKRHGITRTHGDDYSCGQAAYLLGADPTTLLREIRMGYLRAKPHPDYKPRATGQTQYVITERDLREYVIAHPVRLNLRKLPAGHVPWFIELVAGRAGFRPQE